jgi:hypothetical protein
MLGTENAQQKTQCITSLFLRHPELLYNPKDRHAADRNVYSSAAIKLSTNVRNHLVMNLPTVINKLLNIQGFQKPEVHYCRKRICGWKKRVGKYPDPEVTPEMENVIEIARQLLGLEGTQDIGALWLKNKDNLRFMLRFFVHVNRALATREESVFALLPVCKVRSHFITLDAHSIYGVLKDCKLFEGSADKFLKEKSDVMKKVFKIPKREGFTGTMETDGISVCFHHLKKKEVVEVSKGEKSFLKGRVIGIDPGRSNILFASEVLPSGAIKSYRLTRSQYYKESGIWEAKKHTEMWHKSIQTELSALSKVSSKGAALEGFLEYLRVFVSVRDAMWEEYLKRHWGRQRLGLYGGKKRAFAKFLNRLESADGSDNRKPCVAFGAAKFAPGGKGEISVPTSRAFKECCNRFKTVAVDEFRTSRVSWMDDRLLEPVGRSDLRVAIRGLFWCGSTINNKYANRDANGALNIRRCGMAARPMILDRKNATGKLPNIPIRMWLKC